jgi:hypothetical protein
MHPTIFFDNTWKHLSTIPAEALEDDDAFCEAIDAGYWTDQRADDQTHECQMVLMRGLVRVPAVLPPLAGDDVHHRTLRDILARDRYDDDAHRWIVPRLIARGRSHSLNAKHKIGKSELSLCATVDAAKANANLLVMYFDFEMTEDDVQDRLEEMDLTPEDVPDNFLYFFRPMLPALDTPEGGQAFLDIIDDYARPWCEQLVIIDTFSRVLGSGVENDNDPTIRFHRYTGMPLKERGVTVWRLDHKGKDPTKQGARGGSSKGDDVDVIWDLERTKEGVRLKSQARMSWVPETVEYRRSEAPLAYSLVEAEHGWTVEAFALADMLDRLGVPDDAGRDICRAALKDAGEQASNALLAQAIRYRRSPLRGREPVRGQVPEASAETVRGQAA